MSDSIDLKKIRVVVEKYDAKLKATDKRFRKCVLILDQEGTTCFYNHAFLMKIHVREKTKSHGSGLIEIIRQEQNWIIAFTEHHGYHIYDAGDLNGHFQFDIDEGIKELK